VYYLLSKTSKNYAVRIKIQAGIVITHPLPSQNCRELYRGNQYGARGITVG